MKKFFFVAVAIFLYKMAFCQSQTLSTIGQIYNFEVGDTFEYSWSNYQQCASWDGVNMIIITSKSMYSDSVIYFFNQLSTPYYGYTVENNICDPYYVPPFPAYNGTIGNSYNSLITIGQDSSIFSGFFPCSDSNTICGDSIFFDSLYYGRKQNTYYNIEDLGGTDETYVEGLGLVNRNNFGEMNGDFIQVLVYYHKASGEMWGTPLIDALFTGVTDLENNLTQLKVFPNPAAGIITVDYNFTDWDVGIVSLVIVNELGQVVYSQPVPEYSGYQRIDVSRYASGIYMVYIKQDGQVVAAQKFAR